MVVAVFVKAINYKDSVILNEINYNSSSDFKSEDWVELYNRSDSAINISNWIFKDEDDTHSFSIPEMTILKSNSYLVLCNDSLLFTTVFPNTKNFIGNLGYGFSGGGELLRLFDDQLNLIDSVHYDDALPWPTEADGHGSTLELLNPNLNNDLPENWAASSGNGTPGEKNSKITAVVGNNKTKIPENFKLFQNYPNPFNPATTIRYAVSNAQFVSLKVYDVLGNEIATLVNKQKLPGYYSVFFDARNLASGIYIYKLTAGKFISSKKLILIK